MATKRIKALATIAPTAAKYIAHEGDTGGTGKATVEDVVAVGAEAIGLSPLGLDVQSFYDELEDLANGGPWLFTESVDGGCGGSSSAIALGTSTPFPSRGCASLQIAVSPAGGSKASMIRPSTGLMFSDTQPLVLHYRTTKPIRASTFAVDPNVDGAYPCTMTWGAVGRFSGGSPLASIGIVAGIVGGARTWRYLVIDGDPMSPVYETFTMPSCTYFEVRITATASGATVEIAPDGGAFSLVHTSSTPTPTAVYSPFAQIDLSGGCFGDAIVVIDTVRGTGDRNTTHAGVVSEGFNIKSPVQTSRQVIAGTGLTGGGDLSADRTLAVAYGSSGSTACVGNDSRLSDSRAASSVSSGVLVSAAASLAADLGINSKKITSQADPTAATDGANARYADQPTTRTISGTTGTLGAADLGGIIYCSNAGTVTITTANLSSSLRSGGAASIAIVMTGGGTLAIADGSGCTHGGSPSGTSSWWSSPNGTTWYVR